MLGKRFSRRGFLAVSGATGMAALAAACQQAPAVATPQVIRETVVVEMPVEVTRVVESQVEVTRVVQEEVEVTRVVQEEVQVTQIVTVEVTPTPSGQPVAGGILIDFVGKDPGELDPTAPSALANTGFLAQHMYDGLVWLNHDGQLEPRLAESWEWVDDTTIVFTLRQGVKFHNGRDVTVEDWVWSLTRYMSPELGAIGGQTLASLVASVTAKGDNQLEIKAKEPNVVLLNYLNGGGSVVVCKEEVEAAGGVMKTTACGTGPFMLEEWVPNSHVSYTKNPDFWGVGLPYLDGIRVQVIPEESGVVAALRAGQLHRGRISKGENFDLLAAEPNLVARADTPSSGPLRLNVNRHHVLKDKLLRQAVSKGINRQQVVDTLVKGRGVTSGPLSPALKGYALPQDEIDQLQAYDPEGAKALMAEAGYDGETKRLNLICLSIAGYEGALEVAEIVQANLKEVGIDVEIRHQEVGIWVAARIENFEYDLSWNGLGGLDPDEVLWVQYHSTSDVAKWINLADPELDAALEAGRKETDVAKRMEIYQNLQRHMIEDVSEVFLYTPFIMEVLQPTVQGYRTHPGGDVRYDDVWLSA